MKLYRFRAHNSVIQTLYIVDVSNECGGNFMSIYSDYVAKGSDNECFVNICNVICFMDDSFMRREHAFV